MKLLGGKWSKGDILALIGVAAAVLAIPGMPKLFHWDSDKSQQVQASDTTTRENPQAAIARRVPKVRDVSSGQVNFGCDQSLQVETPVVSFGKNPKDIQAHANWINTDNVKDQNQSVVNIEDPVDRHVTGVKAVGPITGRDSEVILGVRNCPGGGHGELTLHVTWTDEE
jgi:hypothetical protein